MGSVGKRCVLITSLWVLFEFVLVGTAMPKKIKVDGEGSEEG